MNTDLHTPPHHYTLLILVEALLLTLFVVLHDHTLRLLVASLVGLSYFFWGFMTHARELKTVRLMLEYASVGLLATVILVVLVSTT